MNVGKEHTSSQRRTRRGSRRPAQAWRRKREVAASSRGRGCGPKGQASLKAQRSKIDNTNLLNGSGGTMTAQTAGVTSNETADGAADGGCQQRRRRRVRKWAARGCPRHEMRSRERATRVGGDDDEGEDRAATRSEDGKGRPQVPAAGRRVWILKVVCGSGEEVEGRGTVLQMLGFPLGGSKEKLLRGTLGPPTRLTSD